MTGRAIVPLSPVVTFLLTREMPELLELRHVLRAELERKRVEIQQIEAALAIRTGRSQETGQPCE